MVYLAFRDCMHPKTLNPNLAESAAPNPETLNPQTPSPRIRGLLKGRMKVGRNKDPVSQGQYWESPHPEFPQVLGSSAAFLQSQSAPQRSQCRLAMCRGSLAGWFICRFLCSNSSSERPSLADATHGKRDSTYRQGTGETLNHQQSI